MQPLIWIGVVGGALWLWRDSLRSREEALRRARLACQGAQVQLLDQTVSLTGLGLGRGPDGRVRLRRRYRFEFSHDGLNRAQGRVELLGRRVQSLQLDLPDGTTIW